MRAITPIVAIIVLVLMTVAAAGMAYFTITTFQTQTATGAQGGLRTLTETSKTQLKIESVSGGKVYLRNLGSETFENPLFYIENRPVNFTGPDKCEPGKICVYTIQEAVNCTGECELSMGEDMPIGTKVKVKEEEVQFEQPPVPSLGLRLEKSVEWPVGYTETSSYVGDVDGDGWDEIVVAESGGTYNLTIWNYTNGNLMLENRTDFGSDLKSVYAGDVDNDGAVEIILTGSNIRILNKTGDVFLLENYTSWSGSDGKVYFANTDGDSQAEIVDSHIKIEGMDSNLGLVYWNKTGNILLNETQVSGTYTNVMSINEIKVFDYDNDGVNETLVIYSSPPTLCMGPPCPQPNRLFIVNRTVATGYEPEIEHDDYIGDYSLDVHDLDNDGIPELIFAGIDPYALGELQLYNYTNLTAYSGEANVTWSSLGHASAYDSVSYDVDGDGTVEIISGGYTVGAGNLYGELRVWNYTSNMIQLENSTIWQYDSGGDTTIRSVHVSDLDKDGTPEIITIGSANDASGYNVQIRVWNYTVG